MWAQTIHNYKYTNWALNNIHYHIQKGIQLHEELEKSRREARIYVFDSQRLDRTNTERKYNS